MPSLTGRMSRSPLQERNGAGKPILEGIAPSPSMVTPSSGLLGCKRMRANITSQILSTCNERSNPCGVCFESITTTLVAGVCSQSRSVRLSRTVKRGLLSSVTWRVRSRWGLLACIVFSFRPLLT